MPIANHVDLENASNVSDESDAHANPGYKINFNIGGEF
jgi:hypothetical protein